MSESKDASSQLLEVLKKVDQYMRSWAYYSDDEVENLHEEIEQAIAKAEGRPDHFTDTSKKVDEPVHE